MWNRSVSGRSIKSFGCTKMLERKAIDRVKANLWKILPTEGSHYLKTFRPIAYFMANFRDRINCSCDTASLSVWLFVRKSAGLKKFRQSTLS